MFSIHKRSTADCSLWAVLFLAVAFTGCAARETTVPFDPIAAEPAPESAMAIRNFEPSNAVYNNTSVITYSTHTPLISDPKIPDERRILVEPLIFLANVAISPISFAVVPPLSPSDEKAWRTVAVPPTSTAAPAFESVVPVGTGPILPALRPDLFAGPPAPSAELSTGGTRNAKREGNPLEGKILRTPPAEEPYGPNVDPLPLPADGMQGAPAPAEPGTVNPVPVDPTVPQTTPATQPS